MLSQYTQKHEHILLALAQYQMLTYKHLIQLGLGKHKPNLFKYLKLLRESRRKLVDSIYIIDAHENKVGIKKEVMFYLTKRGVRFLVDQIGYPEDKIKYPKGKITLLTSDTHHRKRLLSCAIELFKNAKKEEIIWHDFYFEYDNKRRKARINLDERYIETDMLFLLEIQKQYLFGLEYERKPDINRICDKIYTYVKAIAQGQPTIHLVSQKKMVSHRDIAVLYVFEDEKKMYSVIDRLVSDFVFEQYNNHFFFKPFEEIIKGSFFENWLTINKERKSIL